MTELKNTPGPWKVIEGGWENSFICANDGTLIAICKIHTETTQKTRSKYKEIKQANADLLADAWQLPDLRREIAELKAINKELEHRLSEMAIAVWQVRRVRSEQGDTV